MRFKNLTNTHIAKLYGLRAEQLQNTPYPPAYALNNVVDRIVIAVKPGDGMSMEPNSKVSYWTLNYVRY